MSGEPVDRAAPRRRWSPAQTLLPLAGFVLLALLLFGIPVLRDPAHRFVGVSDPHVRAGWTDPSIYMWSFAWWPHTVGHLLNPLFTDRIWAPQGFPLVWGQTAPGPALVLAPVTLAAGPVVAYNVAMLLAPALSAWTAFLLCRWVTGAVWPSVAGGLVFGFSSYELGHLMDHLNLALVFVVPLVALLVARFVRGDLRPSRFVPLLAVALVAQFSISPEVFVTMTAVGAAAMVSSLALFPRERGRVAAALAWTVASYGVALAVLSPYLVATLRAGFPGVPTKWASQDSLDVANLAVPTTAQWFRPGAWGRIAESFRGGLDEQGGYLATLPVIALLFAWRERRRPRTWLLLGVAVVSLLGSLGPVAEIGGRAVATLPWAPLGRIPILREALPVRLTLYAWLALAVVTAAWLAGPRSGARAAFRWGCLAITVALLFPNLGRPLWRSTAPQPAFFTPAVAGRLVRPDEIVLVVPFGKRGFSMLWQAESGMRFRMAGGYVSGLTPSSYAGDPLIQVLKTGRDVALGRRLLPAFLARHRVRAIVVVDRTPGAWAALFGGLGVRPEHVGGVRLYRLPPAG